MRPPYYVRRSGGQPTGRYPNSGNGCLWIVGICIALIAIGYIVGGFR